MARILILFSTVDGHTLRICDRLRTLLEARGDAVVQCAVEESAALDVASFDKIVIGASIRYGKHRPNVYGFIEQHRALLDARPCAFFTVNIVARKAAKNRPQTNPYLRKFLRQSGWQPRELAVFAGKLDYPKYGWFDRQMIRLIMKITGGPTDPATVVDYTDWSAVDALASRIGAL